MNKFMNKFMNLFITGIISNGTKTREEVSSRAALSNKNT